MRFSTDAFPEAERLEAFREEFACHVTNLDVGRLDDPERGPFRSIATAAQLGNVMMMDCAGTPVEFSRGGKRLTDGDDSFTFLLNPTGSMRVIQKDAAIAHVEPGLLVIDHGQTVRAQCSYDQLLPTNGSYSHRGVCFVVPRQALSLAVPDLDAYVGKPFEQKTIILEYLMRYSEEIVRNSELANDPAFDRAMGDHVFDLIVTLLRPTKDAAQVASRRGLRVARLNAVLAFIERNLDSPGLNSQMIASHHGISRRYVFQLMDENGETLSRYILRRRLDVAAAMASDPSMERMRISDIAYACGFNDLSNFSREFKRRFGNSPRSFRGQKASFAV